MDEIRGDSAHLTVSIVTYNSSLELLRRTLESLQVAAARAMPEWLAAVEVTIVDNASGDEYREQLARLLAEFPAAGAFQIRSCNLERNRGYGGGHNQTLGDSDFHLVLNPDVELAEDALAAGISRLQESPGTVLLSPRATGPAGEREFLCKRHPSVFVLLLRAFAPRLGERWFPHKMASYQMSDACTGDLPVEVPLASGCCMLLRGSSLRAINGFDETYFMYFEDFDLSLRLAPEGRLEYLPAMRIVHHGGYAGRKGLAHVRLFAGAGLRFFRQHGWRWF